MLVKRHFDRGLNFSVLERFNEVSKRFGKLGALEGAVLGKRGEIDDGDVPALTNLLGDRNPVLIPFDPNIHEHQVGTARLHQRQRFAAPVRHSRHFVAQIRETVLYIQRHDDLVFHDQDSGRLHPSVPFMPSGREKRSRKRSPDHW